MQEFEGHREVPFSFQSDWPLRNCTAWQLVERSGGQTKMSRTFLIVDDEPIVRMEIVELIRQNGFDAIEAGSTAEALSMLQQAGDAFFGLITDVNMPGTRNGMVLANHVRTVWPHIRVIVVSGGRKPFSGELPDNTAFIAKPWRPEQIVMALGQS